MRRYFRSNPLKRTFMEDLRIARSWKVVFLWIPKLLRQRVERASPMPFPFPFQNLAVAPEQVSTEAVARLLPSLREAAELGFEPPLYQTLSRVAGESLTTAAHCRHSGGEVTVRIIHVLVRNIHPPRERVALGLVSRLKNGRWLLTGNQPKAFNSAPNIVIQIKVGTSLADLFRLHQKKLADMTLVSPVERVRDDAELMALSDRYEGEGMEFNLRRGVFEEVTEEEVLKLTPTVVTPPIAPPGEIPPVVAAVSAAGPQDSVDAAVLSEIEKIRNKRGNWRTAWLVGLLSLAAFVGLGGAHWDWEFALILTGLVVFHEFGHYVMMRVFHYKDLRMFFIPLLGAAVSGRHYNVKGWQRALVSLAGPVPGVVLGLGLTAVAWVTGNPLVERVALIALLLNGINLLPLLPLDGGWVLHATLFSRHFVLETGFLLFATAGLIGASVLGFGSFWTYLGLFLLLGLPVSYRQTRAAARLRERGVTGVSPDNETIPAETALAILGELKKDQKFARSMKQLASQTLDIFQKLNSTPPGVLATILLLAVYLGAGFGSVAGVGALIVHKSGLFSDRANRRGSEYTRRADPTSFKVAGETNEASVDWLAPEVMVTFDSEAEASGAFEKVQMQLEPRGRLFLFGQTLLISGSNAPAKWSTQFKKAGAEVLLEYPASNITAMVQLSCRAPDTATADALELELDVYFQSPWVDSCPPWVRWDKLDTEAAAAARRIETTRLRLGRMEQGLAKDPEYRRLARLATIASLRRKTADAKNYFEKYGEYEKAFYRRELARIEASTEEGVDREIVAIYGRQLLSTNSIAEARLLEQLGRTQTWRVGALPMKDRHPASLEAWRAATSGGLARNKLSLDLNYTGFYRLDPGLPAFVEYLRSKGCTDFRYEMIGISNVDELKAEEADK